MESHKLSNKNVCSLCLEELPTKVDELSRLTCCGNTLHHRCCDELLHSRHENCPLCRNKVPTTETEVVETLLNHAHSDKAWAQSILSST